MSCAPDAGGPGSFDYAVEVLGSKSSFEAFALSAEGFESAPPRYTSRYFSQWFSLRSLACNARSSFTFESAAGDGVKISRQTLSPFMCPSFDDCAARLASGQHAQETHQLFLDAHGLLLKDTDFEHRLRYTCEWRSAGSQDSEGSASLQSDAGTCAEASRSGTRLVLRELASGQPWGSAETCNGYLIGSLEGVLVAQISFMRQGETAQLSLGHCLGPDPALPLLLTAETLRSEPCAHGGASLVLAQGARERQLLPLAGTWQIDALDESRDGHQTGSISMTFGEGTEPEFQVSGSIVLPNLQVPEGSK